MGYYHISFDLTDVTSDLPNWLTELAARMAAIPELPPLKTLLPPRQQQIGNCLWEVAFIADIDGLPLEFIRSLATLS